MGAGFRTILSSCNGSRSFSMQTTVDRITMLLACEVVRRLGVVASQPDLLEGWPNPCLVCQRGGGARAANGGANMAAQQQIEDLNTQVLEMKLTVEGLEKERDFYFGKLRDVEVMCQENESTGGDLVRKVLDILYQTEDGFAVPDEEDVPPPPEEGDEEY